MRTFRSTATGMGGDGIGRQGARVTNVTKRDKPQNGSGPLLHGVSKGRAIRTFSLSRHDVS